MRSDYEIVSNDLDILFNLLWDSLAEIHKDNRSALSTKKTRKSNTIEAFGGLRAELMEKHGWSYSEWVVENERRVNLYLETYGDCTRYRLQPTVNLPNKSQWFITCDKRDMQPYLCDSTIEPTFWEAFNCAVQNALKHGDKSILIVWEQ